MGQRMVPVIAGVLLSTAAFAQASTDAPGAAAPPFEKKRILPPLPAEPAPTASPRLASPHDKDLPTLVARWFDGHVGRRIYIQTDKPLYKPGETIWFKTWDLEARSLARRRRRRQTHVELVSPKGAAVLEEANAHAAGGAAATTSSCRAEAQGGEYTLRATATRRAAGRAQRHRLDLRGAAAQEEARVRAQGLRRGRRGQRHHRGQAAHRRAARRQDTSTAVVTVDGDELPRVNGDDRRRRQARCVKFDLPKTIAARRRPAHRPGRGRRRHRVDPEARSRSC